MIGDGPQRRQTTLGLRRTLTSGKSDFLSVFICVHLWFSIRQCGQSSSVAVGLVAVHRDDALGEDGPIRPVGSSIRYGLRHLR
jgi:hypothetical protein